MIMKQKIGVECDNDTKLCPESVVSNKRIAGFAMFKYFKKHTLEGKKKSQWMLAENKVFSTYTALGLGSDNRKFFEKCMSKGNTQKVQNLCQHTNA